MHSKHWLHINQSAKMSIALFLFLCGLGFARLKITPDFALIPTLTILGFLGWALQRRTKVVWVVSAGLLIFVCGWVRGNSYMQKLKLYDQVLYRPVIFMATVEDDAVYSERGQLTFSVSRIILHEPYDGNLVGSIKVEGRGVGMVYRGDHVRVEGKLYPRRGGQQAGVSFAEISVLHSTLSPVDTLRRKFAVSLQNVLPEPLASLELGLLIGQRSTLPNYLTEQLVAVGLIHIVAVSGYNLTVIVNATQRLFKKRSRYQTVVFSLSLIGVFLLFTGYSPSIIRAALISSISLILWFFGRRMKAVPLILFAAAITAGVNPLYLWSSIGWYLSFVAFFGVLVLAPLVLERIRTKRIRENIFVQILCETCAAQICTIPLILYIFGRVSIVSVMANMLVVPLVPIAMLTGLVCGVSSLFDVWFTPLFVWPTRLVLEYMISLSTLLSRVPHASLSVTATLIQMIFMYVLIICVTCILYIKKLKRDQLIHGD